MKSNRYNAVTNAGRHIGTYTISDAMLLFKGAASLRNGKILVDEKRCGTIDGEHGWRTIREDDGTDSYWTSDAFEQRFGIAFALNISSMDDVRHFARLEKKVEPDESNRATRRGKLQDSGKRGRASGVKSNEAMLPDTEFGAGQNDRYVHSHTREIPFALGYHWKRENGNIYCVDDDGNKISESYLKSEIEVYWSDLLLDDTHESSWDYDGFDYHAPTDRYDSSSESDATWEAKSASGRYGEADSIDKYAHSRTRPIPPALHYRWVNENGNIYCVDKCGRKITELRLRAEIDALGMRKGCDAVATTRESSEHAELRRRNEEIMNRAMREHRNDHLKPAGWEATQRHNEEKAKEKQRWANKKKREEAASRKREASVKKKAEAEATRRAVVKATPAAAGSGATEQKGESAPVRKTSSSSMTDKQCLLKALFEIQDPFVAEAVKSMFHSINMAGIVERALMLLRSEPHEDKPVSLNLFATENVVRYQYCKIDSIRLYCFRIVAEAIGRKVSEASAEGPEPYIWALENSKGKQGARKRAAMSILNDTEHLILFSDEVVQKASSCIDELTILPYPTTLVRIEGIPNTWGAVAYESSKGIEIATIGERSCEKTARRLLAYVENHCTAQSYDGYSIYFETSSSRLEGASDHFAEPIALLPTSRDQRTHIIKAESEGKRERPGEDIVRSLNPLRPT